MPAITRTLAAVCAAAAASAALTGCARDDSGGVSAPLLASAATTSAKPEPFADLTAAQLLDRAEQDMRDAGALTYEMSGADDGGTLLHIKAAVTSGRRCVLAADAGGERAQLIVTDGTETYLKGDESFWEDNADAKVAGRLADKWVKIPASEYGDSDLTAMCDLDGLMDALSAGDNDAGTTLTKGEPTTLGGTQVIPLVQTSSDGTTTIYVSTGDTPYVLRTEDKDLDPPDIGVFSDFGKQPKITTPPPALTVDPKDLGSGPDGGFHI